MQIKKSFRKTILRCLMVFLAVAVTVTMTPVGMDEAYAETTLTTEKPEILVSGTAVIGGDAYSESNKYYEKAYTLDELKNMSDNNEILYSALNSKGHRKFYRAKGVKVNVLLYNTSFNAEKDKLTFIPIPSDAAKYTVVFDPNGSGDTAGFGEGRYYYNKEVSTTEGIEVDTILSWASLNAEDKVPEGDLKVNTSCTLILGQLDYDDVNNPLFSKNIQQVIGGNKLTKAELTVDGKGYTRGDILLMERTIRSDEKDTVRGVSLNELLKDYDNSTKVKFKTADGNEQEITKGDLVKGNSVLAYEIKTEVAARATTNNDMYVGIYDSKDNNYGLFRLYSDNQEKPLEMVNAIEIVKEDSGAATDNPPAADSTADNASDDNDKTADTEDKPDTSAKTGDEMPIGLLAGVLAAAAAGIFGTLCIRRKTN